MLIVPKYLTLPTPREVREPEDMKEFARRKAVNGPWVCPWCSSKLQFTDWRGTCTQCRLPWDRDDWMEHHYDRAESQVRRNGEP